MGKTGNLIKFCKKYGGLELRQLADELSSLKKEDNQLKHELKVAKNEKNIELVVLLSKRLRVLTAEIYVKTDILRKKAKSIKKPSTVWVWNEHMVTNKKAIKKINKAKTNENKQNSDFNSNTYSKALHGPVYSPTYKRGKKVIK